MVIEIVVNLLSFGLISRLWMIIISIFLQLLLHFFSLLDYCHVVWLHQPKTNSPPPDLSAQGYHHWEAWDLLPDSLVWLVG
jgi:hypothetical protein